MYSLFVRFDSLRPSQQFFSYVRTSIPGLNQYLAEYKVSCSRTHYAASFSVRFKPITPPARVKHSITELGAPIDE